MPSPSVDRTEMSTAMSPKVKTTSTQMDFFDALRAIMDGERVTRLEWQDPEYYCDM